MREYHISKERHHIEKIILSEVSQIEKDKFYMISLIHGI